ncbi:MAG: rhodanese-like domain-containing protein [bacterium]
MERDELSTLEISPEELNEKLEEGEHVSLIDVRTSREREFVHLDDDEWIPMKKLPAKIDHLQQKESPVIFYCHHGVRSLQAARRLTDQNLDDVRSLAGGIDYWARNINTDLPTY